MATYISGQTGGFTDSQSRAIASAGGRTDVSDSSGNESQRYRDSVTTGSAGRSTGGAAGAVKDAKLQAIPNPGSLQLYDSVQYLPGGMNVAYGRPGTIIGWTKDKYRVQWINTTLSALLAPKAVAIYSAAISTPTQRAGAPASPTTGSVAYQKTLAKAPVTVTDIGGIMNITAKHVGIAIAAIITAVVGVIVVAKRK